MVKQFLKKIARRVLGRRAPEKAVASTAEKSAPKSAHKTPPKSAAPPPRQHAASGHGHHGPASHAHSHHAPAAHRPEPRSRASAVHHAAPPVPWNLDSFQVPVVEGRTRFHDLDLPPEIMHAVADLGFEYCTPIQAQALLSSIVGRNLTGRAQTGTGKTAAFLIAVFTRFLRNPPPAHRTPGKPRALVIAPTRELVIQIAQDAKDLTTHCDINSLAVFGGMDYDRQERMLKERAVDLIAATPGRLLDFARRGTLDLSAVEVLVIDEADRMLDMGFIPDVRDIIRRLPPKDRRQTLLFSATLTEDVKRLASQWMDNPVVTEVEPEQVAVKTIKQLVYAVSSREKFTLLYNLLRQPETVRVLVFGNRRDGTLRLADALRRHGINCGLLSGAIDQNKRVRILDDFKEGRVPVLVATDVAGRGLHIDDVSHVINYDFPYEADDYVHRIGRTGRAGQAGTAISFACEDESFIIPEIEKYIGEPLVCRQPEEHLLAKLPPALRGIAPLVSPSESQAGRAPYRGGGSGGRGARPRGRSGPPRRSSR